MTDFNPGIRPCGGRVLVWVIPTERKTAGGILIPDVAADREDMAQVKAVVVAVGPSAWSDQVVKDWAKAGDTVLIAKYAGLTHKGTDGKVYRVIHDLDVVAVEVS